MRRIVLVVMLAAAACATPESGMIRSESVAPTRVETNTGDYELDTNWESSARGGVVAASVEEAWRLLPVIYAEFGIPGNLADPDAGIYGVRGRRMPRRVGGEGLVGMVDCGSGPAGPNALFYEVVLDVLTRIRPAENGVRVETLVSGAARDRTVGGHPVRCTTRGKLERMIAERMAELIEG